MTYGQAREWVHTQTIVLEPDAVQLLDAVTVLTAGAPRPADRRYGLFRRCCEIVIASAPAATPDLSSTARGGSEAGRAVRADPFRC